MPMVEIDDSQLANMQGVVGLVTRMMGHKDARKHVLSAQKLVNPNIPIPEIDEVAQGVARYEELNGKISEHEKKLQAIEEKREEEKRLAVLENRWNTGRRKLRRAGYTDEALEAIEKIMEEKSVLDHEVAAAFYEKSKPQPETPFTGGMGYDFFSIKNTDGQDKEAMRSLLAGDENSFFSHTIPKAIQEIRSGRR